MKKIVFTLFTVLICLSATAQWSSNPHENNRISPNQWTLVPEIKTAPSGLAYFTYRKLSADGIYTYLQIIDQEGNLKYPQEGRLISDYPSRSDVQYNDFSFVDKDENLILIVSDSRYGESLRSFTVYKISPEGEMLWDEDGIGLDRGNGYSNNAGIKVIQLEDQSYVFAWMKGGAYDMSVEVQRLSKDGEFLWTDPVTLFSTTINYSYPYLVNAGNNEFILIYAKGSNYEFYARKMDFEGTSVWPEDTRIYRDGFTIPAMQVLIDVTPDHKGGVFFAWYDDRFSSRFESAYVAYVKSDGSLGFVTANDWEGQKIGYVESQRSFRPKIAYDKASEALYVVWESSNEGQTYRSLRIQKLSDTGDLLWGPEGKLIAEPYTGSHSIQLAGDGKFAVFYMILHSAYGQVTNHVALFDSNGDYVWENETITFSTNESYKDKLESCPLINNEYWLTFWSDSRVEENEKEEIDIQGIFVQRINIDGTLGSKETPIQLPESGAKTELLTSSVIDNETHFTLNNPKAAHVNLSIYSLSGQKVAVVYNGILGAGKQILSWNPKAASIGSGVYLLRFSTPDGSRTSRVIIK
jgi:hypothetical protein